MTSPDRFTRDPHEELRDCRNAIEVVDRRIVALLAQRMTLARRAAQAKQQAGLPLVDMVREAEVFHRVATEARANDLPPDGVEQVFDRIVALSRRVQEETR